MIWSASFLLIKIGVGGIGPATLTCARLTIAALILWLFMRARNGRLPLHRRALLLYLVVGVMGNALPFTLISWGETHIDSSLAAIMIGAMPIVTFVLAHFFVPDEPMSARTVFGVCLGLGGLLTLIGWSALAGIGGGHVLGQLAVLSAAICYGVTTVFVRTQPPFPGLQMATGAVLAAMLISIVPAFYFEDPFSMTPNFAQLGALAALGVFQTALAALLYFRVIRNLGATTFSQINYAVPILGGLWGVLLLGEVLQFRMLIALALVLVGVYFVQRRAIRVRD